MATDPEMQLTDDLDSKEKLLRRIELWRNHNESDPSTLMQRDAGADPRLIDVEIDAHHFALTHPHKVVD